jgi:hypothetical protein
MAYSTGSRSVSATYQLRRKAIMIIIILLVPAAGSAGTKCIASATDPALPSIVFNALNSFLILIVIIGAIWVGYGMVHDMIEAHE